MPISNQVDSGGRRIVNDDDGLVIPVHYIKSPSCTEIVVHGAYGGINIANGRLSMAVFAERGPIPRVVNIRPHADGSSDETLVEGREGIVRSVAAVLHFDVNTAIALQKWLNDKIDAFKGQNPEMFEGEAK